MYFIKSILTSEKLLCSFQTSIVILTLYQKESELQQVIINTCTDGIECCNADRLEVVSKLELEIGSDGTNKGDVNEVEVDMDGVHVRSDMFYLRPGGSGGRR